MPDLIFLALSVAVFAAFIGLTYFFERARNFK
jgi:hypothetical protein